MRSCATVSSVVLLAAALVGARPACLGAQEHETIRTLLIGPRETATVELTLIGPQANDTLTPWRLSVPPLAIATGTAARLWTDLPISIGDLVVPPGTHRLRLEAGRTLVVTRETGDSAWEGRVTLAETPGAPRVMGWSLRIVTRRLGEDTLSIAQTRGASEQVITLGYGPATRSMLRLRWRDRELVVPIAAR